MEKILVPTFPPIMEKGLFIVTFQHGVNISSPTILLMVRSVLYKLIERTIKLQ